MTSRPDGAATRSTRRTYIDWARGLAVLIMIEAHVLDAWTLRSERTSTAFGYLNILGGSAAPLFLWLAGLSLVLAAEQGERRTGDRRGAGLALARRGLEIFALAFIFRAQSFIVSPGNPLVSLLRVDILNIMGPSMAAAALLWWLARGARLAVVLACGVAAAIAFVTPLVRTAPWLGLLPPAVQWYISPSGNHSTFTLFHWSGWWLVSRPPAYFAVPVAAWIATYWLFAMKRSWRMPDWRAAWLACASVALVLTLFALLTDESLLAHWL